MSGIFKGDSIYKNGGGGGGGYSDGGELIDSDFIKVENNAVSSYKNTSRDPVNFYVEVQDGEVINSVIEFSTEINSTINVYYYKNGFYYLMSNIGGNSVTANNDYKINIVGDSYKIEQTSNPNVIPSFVDIGCHRYKIVELNGLLWCTENYINGDIGIFKGLTNNYYYRQSDMKNFSVDGWRLPTKDEIISLVSFLGPNPALHCKTDYGWLNGWNGDNANGLTIGPPHSFLDQNNNVVEMIGTEDYWAENSGNKMYYYSFTSSGQGIAQSDITTTKNKFSVRLVHDL